MARNIVNRIDRNLARRLREARKEVGLSTRAVAAKMPRKVPISHATIASYEKGTTVPSVDILAALSGIYQRPINWFMDARSELTDFCYRNLESRVGLAEQRQYAAIAGKWAEAYFKLEKHLNRRRQHNILKEPHSLTACELAALVRRVYLNLDDNQPVPNMVCALESFSTWAMELRATFEVDGAAGRFDDNFIVFINPSVTNDRVRMNAAHELAHVLAETSELSSESSGLSIDENAYDFSCSLLLPDSQLQEAFDGKSFLKLIQYKERFGISLAAMIHRAEKLHFINTSASRWLRAEMRRKGWRQNEPGYVWKDRAISFEMTLESAVHTKLLTWKDAERITGICESELLKRIEEITSPLIEEEVLETLPFRITEEPEATATSHKRS